MLHAVTQYRNRDRCELFLIKTNISIDYWQVCTTHQNTASCCDDGDDDDDMTVGAARSLIVDDRGWVRVNVYESAMILSAAVQFDVKITS